MLPTSVSSICLPPIHSSSGNGSLVSLLAVQLPSFSEHMGAGVDERDVCASRVKDIPLGAMVGSGMGMRQF